MTVVKTVETTTMRVIKPALVAGELAERAFRGSNVRDILMLILGEQREDWSKIGLNRMPAISSPDKGKFHNAIEEDGVEKQLESYQPASSRLLPSKDARPSTQRQIESV